MTTTTPQAETVILTVTNHIFSDETGANVEASMARFADILEQQVKEQVGNRILDLEVRTHHGDVHHSTEIYAGPDMAPQDEDDLRVALDHIGQQVLAGEYGEWVVEV